MLQFSFVHIFIPIVKLCKLIQLNIKLQQYEYQVLVQNNKNHVKSIIPVIYNLKSVGGKNCLKKMPLSLVALFFSSFFYFWVSLGGGCLFCVCVCGGGGKSTLICYSFSYRCDIIIHQLLFFFSFFFIILLKFCLFFVSVIMLELFFSASLFFSFSY